MQAITAKRVLMVLIAVFSLSLMIGCAGREYAHKDPYPYIVLSQGIAGGRPGCRSSASSRQGQGMSCGIQSRRRFKE